MKIKLCDYGCGKEARFLLKFKNSEKWCCSEKYSACKSNIKTWNKGLTKETDERVKKYSINKIGLSSWNKGLTKETDERVKKISLSNIGKKISSNHRLKISKSLKGKSKTEDHIKKLSESLKGKIGWNNGLTKETSNSLMIVSKKLKGRIIKQETKEKLRKINLGKKLSEETIIKISKKNKGRKRTPEQIKNHRNSIKGNKNHKMNHYIETYPDFIKLELLEEDSETKDLIVICSICNLKFTQNNREKISYRAQMIILKKMNQGMFYCSKECKEKFINKNKNDYEIYSRKVWKNTYQSVKEQGSNIKNIELRGRKYKYQLDHKYSIIEGFKNNIDPKIIGHWKNLEIISDIKNTRKLGKCSITIQELIQEINNII
jgi:hypothetical protein